ncbi:AAA family ATPase [Sulfuritalea sp.]|uniref:AAA family ATPase n=1 Tax=Sulfuritalea sp. TaxID=2480090 RepID=UPI00286D702D|nr:AAA family ATPase [Sulfuritalea sp.]
MALIDEILKWSEEKLPLWQRDAARRLFQQETGLSAEDYGDLYALLKAAHGLPNPLGLTPEPLKAAHLPTILPAGEKVVLQAIRDLVHVNRIAPGQKLNFAQLGLTVIYGGNGSGKSGYVRVMKRACRARDQAEKVHPDANDPAALNRIPKAIFDIDIGGTSKAVHWTGDSDSPDELAAISVFDSHCARAYLTTEQDVAYLPYGLDVVENLANKVLPELARRLNEEIAAISIDRQPLQHLVGETEVGRLVNALSEKTSSAKVKAFSTLSEIETATAKELDAALAEYDPAKKANEHRLSAGRLKSLAERIETALSWVSDAAIDKLKKITDATITANKAEKQAAEALQSGESLLPGTGEPVWKALFGAARKFSTEVAYPEHVFPHITGDAKCPLCQQPLNDAGERLNRFEEYIQNDVAKAAAEQRQKLEATKIKIERANLSVGIDDSLVEELTLLDDAIASSIGAFERDIEARRIWMLQNLNSYTWEDAPPLGENPRKRLRNLAAHQFKSARVFAHAVDEVKKKSLIAKREELRARQNLSASLDAVLGLIERLKMRQALKACEQDLKTRPISDKSKELASGAVTVALKNALDEEFKSLGIGHIRTKLKDRNDKGKIKHQLLLDLPTTNKLEQILSEGEQRAIALGSFLAELKLANHACGIVFDDPVSSLDHMRRGKVAKRLAAESKQRQVLIFTHDVVFLQQLRDQCDKLNVSPLFCRLEANGGFYGNVAEGLPWAHKSYGERIDFLEKAQKRFEKMPWPANPSEELTSEMIRQYSFLRATIERVAQDFVLNGTVQRFKDYIDVKKLKLVIGLQEAEVVEILRINQRCHDLVEAHDPSSAKDEPPPTADELKQDIADLRKLIKDITDRRTGAAQ